MLRLLSYATMGCVTALAVSAAAAGSSDITMASIATGRLLVIGTTERPHTAVMLDDRFSTESDDRGSFQFELVYHPANCIIAASIEGESHEAVVGNCGQQVMPGTWLEPHAAVDPPALLMRLLTAQPEASSALFRPAKRLEELQNSVPALPATSTLPVFTNTAWAYLSVHSEPLPAGSDEAATAVTLTSLEAAPLGPATGIITPHLPAASQGSLAKLPTTFARRQVRHLGVQPASFQPSAPVGIRTAVD